MFIAVDSTTMCIKVKAMLFENGIKKKLIEVFDKKHEKKEGQIKVGGNVEWKLNVPRICRHVPDGLRVSLAR